MKDNYSSLGQSEWVYLEHSSIEQFSTAQWITLDAQRERFFSRFKTEHLVRMLTVSANDASFGYRVNMYRHALQSATMVLRDGLPVEDVVVALFHDVGYTTSFSNHGEVASALLGPSISERNHWMLKNHAVFQNFHALHLPGNDRYERELWRGHPFFDWTAEFVKLYDQATIDPDYPSEPIETFIPMIDALLSSSS
ncbi:MAG: phosphohydrolase [Actinobacteria bacterium]|nr:phosphohydrolase [Actinomycetota bacterium]NBY05890.1 phosphohydrolase [Betaproteobacteria bacterium]